jgi:sulfoxide reductase heme-binding subunit YedZ
MQARKEQWQAPKWLGDLVVATVVLVAIGVLGAFCFRFLPISAVTNTWMLTRAAGIVAYVLLWLAVLGGLLQSTGILTRWMRPVAATDLHNTIGVWSLYATTFHMVVLLWDHYAPFTVAQLLVPFAGSYKPSVMALGILGTYATLAATVSTYFRAKLGPTLWRRIHLLSLLGFLAALIHGVAAGSDSSTPGMLALYAVSGLSTLGLTVYRTIMGVRRNATTTR